MDHLEVILPSLLLLVAFSYKLVVDKRFSFTEFIERCLEMPIEVVFLSGGFMIAFTLQDPSNHEFGLLSMFLGFLSAPLFLSCPSALTKPSYRKNSAPVRSLHC